MTSLERHKIESCVQRIRPQWFKLWESRVRDRTGLQSGTPRLLPLEHTAKRENEMWGKGKLLEVMGPDGPSLGCSLERADMLKRNRDYCKKKKIRGNSVQIPIGTLKQNRPCLGHCHSLPLKAFSPNPTLHYLVIHYLHYLM